MSSAAIPLLPWLSLAGLGFFHGVNPAMGWLFAVALGLHRRDRKVVLASLVPIAAGHAAAVALVAFTVIALGLVVDPPTLRRAAGVILVAWAAWHLARGHRQRPIVGMRTGLAGLALWSFLMASAHGAGLMLVPVIAPLCLSGASPAGLTPGASLHLGLTAVGIHTAAMLVTIAAVSVIVYERVGLAFLRTRWINLDLVWVAALAASGLLLLLVSF